MSIQSICAVIFIVLMLVFLLIKRKRVKVNKLFLFPLLYFAMYRTKIGLKFMDKSSKRFSKALKYTGYFSVFIGFAGMIMITYLLTKNVYNLLTKPNAVPGASLVLPFDVRGAVYVPFFYWIISIFVIALVHEFAHGILARRYNTKIKSSGFAFLGVLIPIIPAAFVEPDEKELGRKQPKQQLSVFAAGPFANILLAAVILVITAPLAAPLSNAIMKSDGILITGFIRGNAYQPYPAEQAGLTPNEEVESVDNIKIMEVKEFSGILKTKKPGDTLIMSTNRSTYNITLVEDPDNKSKAYLGVYVQQKTKIRESLVGRYNIGRYNIIPSAVIWIFGLLGWLYVLNLGIGLFNLAPIGPLDGGRMLLVVLQKFFKKEKAVRYWKNIGFFFLALVLINLLFAFIR